MFAALFIIIVVIEIIRNVFEKPIPRGYMKNRKLMHEDWQKVTLGKMSKGQYRRNMMSGKYYAEPKDYGEISKEEIERLKKHCRNYRG